MQTGRAWWHLMWHTYGTWLPGDPRGFRNRHHRIHSSGDYKNPPPPGEHAGLHRYAKRVSKGEIVLTTDDLRERVGLSLIKTLSDLECPPLVIAVCRVHVHLLADMPVDEKTFNKLVTKLKTKSSTAIRKTIPGRVWARGDKRVMKDDRRAQLKCFSYVRNDQGRNAWVWTFDEGFVPMSERTEAGRKRFYDRQRAASQQTRHASVERSATDDPTTMSAIDWWATEYKPDPQR